MYTKKIFYENMFQTECEATVIEVKENGLILDQTVAYPEGGGQIGDSGVIINTNTDKHFNFLDTNKIPGRMIFLKDFPTISVENKIIHLGTENVTKEFSVGDKVKVKINVERRAGASINHSGLHLALSILENIRIGISKKIAGCKITETSGRIDFYTLEKISKDELLFIEKECKNLIEQKLPIKTYSHQKEKEALYWECNNISIPCGGTHVLNTEDLGNVRIKRKNIGTGVDRLIVEFSNELLINKFQKGLL